MTRSELIALLQSLGVQPSRRLGQNFLADANMLSALVRAAAPVAGERILEVGPGTGVLTRRLLAAGAEVVAVELDHRLAAYLREEFRAEERFSLVEGDACKVDYDELLGDTPFRCIANLPYSCSSVFLARMLELNPGPDACFVLLQREMAERMAAKPGTKTYGALTVRVQLKYEVKIIRIVPPGVFCPPPEVDSAFVGFVRRENAVGNARANFAGELAGVAFSQRRKKAKRLLERKFGEAEVDSAFQRLGLSDELRAERLTVDDFSALAACLEDGMQHV